MSHGCDEPKPEARRAEGPGPRALEHANHARAAGTLSRLATAFGAGVPKSSRKSLQ